MRNLGRSPRRTATLGVLLLAAAVLAVTAVTALAANLIGDGTIVGTTGNDGISAGNQNDTIYGLGGTDSINAGNGNDLIDAGAACPAGVQTGKVYPTGLPAGVYCEDGPVKPYGSDNINAGNGNDTIWGNGGTNSINVGSGKDTVYAYGGPNSINVGNGNSTVFLFGQSNLSIGLGTNTVYAQNGKVDTINCASNKTTVYADKNDKVSATCHVVLTTPPGGNPV